MERDKAKDLVIIGAGGFGREVKWLVERINQFSVKKNQGKKWNLIGFIDDGLPEGTQVEDLAVLGGRDYLNTISSTLNAVCAIGSSRVRSQLMKELQKNKNLYFPNLIDPSVLYSASVSLGIGNIICAGSVLTVNIQIGDFCILNLDCTVGHDAFIGDYTTLYPSVNLSGCTEVEDETEIGTGSHIIQGIKIGKRTILGAGAVVVRDIPSGCTAVGNPAKVIKNRNNRAI